MLAVTNTFPAMFVLRSVRPNSLLDAQQNCMKSQLQINSGNVIEVLFLRGVMYQEFHFISMKVFFFISEPVSVF